MVTTFLGLFFRSQGSVPWPFRLTGLRKSRLTAKMIVIPVCCAVIPEQAETTVYGKKVVRKLVQSKTASAKMTHFHSP